VVSGQYCIKEFVDFVVEKLKALRDSVIVKIDKPYNNEVEYGKLKLEVDVMFNPTHYARIYGEVYSMPRHLTDERYGVIKEGDTVYFHYNVVDDSHLYGDYYSVDVERIFCTVRNGDIIPLCEWVLVNPLVEERKTVNVGGKNVDVRMKGDLVVGINKKVMADKAQIAYISDNDMGLSNKDVVYIQPDFEFKNEIEGKEYYCVRKKDLLGKI
tara:strand:- start:6866 stop:7501 length:636 start_codon:yes stop_codon:yes gene_type:complete